jgi:3'-phosphoadenosine 5'-phosphosulfate (PAPS) 3'-phosphatase
MDKRLYIYLLMVLVLPYVRALRAARVSSLGNSRLYSKLHASPRNDFLITSQPNSNAVILLKSIKPDLEILHKVSQCNILSEGHLWVRYCDGIQLDALLLENRYLGRHRETDEDTAKMWSSDIDKRSSFCPAGQSSTGLYSAELEVALAAVQKSAFVIRSLQRILLTPENHAINQILRNEHSNSETQSSSKADSTPVTVADFAIQALIIDAISKVFPGDLFIAEEDSALVRSDAAIREAVLEILYAATGTHWNAEKLYSALDKGSFAGGTLPTAAETKPTGPQRVWVLDPIDGTKGFMRNEHCCTGLGLLIDGVTQLSVLGCPNLNLFRLLQGSGYDNQNICHIDQPLSLQDGLQLAPKSSSDAPSASAPASSLPTVFHPDCGSVYYAVTDQGAFARSLSMPLGAAFEVGTSATTSSPAAVLCESAEAAYGDRAVTQRTAEALGLTKDYVRIDGKKL